MATEIIEIIGPPGVGKTTLYDALCLQWKPSYNWIHQDAVLSPAPVIKDFRNWAEFKLKSILKRKWSRSVPTEFGLRFVQLHPGLSDFCWQRLSSERSFTENITDIRFRTAFHLYADFCRYQAIAEKGSSMPCVLNEGLLQKSFLIQSDARIMSDLLNRYLMLVPLPAAIIYIDTDKARIVGRLMNRRKVIATHHGKNRDELLDDIVHWQGLLQLTISWMINHQVPVYTIDGARSVSENVLTILKLLGKQDTVQRSHKHKTRSTMDATKVALSE